MNNRKTTTYPLQDYFSSIFKTYDLMNRMFTLGLDRKWRRHAIAACLDGSPDNILDLCCGTGDLAIGICKAANTGVHVTGYDLNADMLKVARDKASACRTVLPEFVQGDVGFMPFEDGSFDCITIGFAFRNLIFENPSSERHISEISRVLEPGGRLLILESALPENSIVALFYKLYLWLFMVPLGGILSGNWHAYRYLARSSVMFYRFPELADMLQQQNLRLERKKKYLFGSANLLVATKTTD